MIEAFDDIKGRFTTEDDPANFKAATLQKNQTVTIGAKNAAYISQRDYT